MTPSLYEDIDGAFPNHHRDPTVDKSGRFDPDRSGARLRPELPLTAMGTGLAS
ncbi:MAG: hypothetical protein R3D66_05195 [Alphaproteobacteria bacterium]